MNIILLGPPGSGKGTQSKIIVKKFNIRQISSGDLLRDAVKRKTVLGSEAYNYMQKGELVPDDIVVNIIKENLKENLDTGFILDGFPRSINQACALDKILNELNRIIDFVINLVVCKETILTRLSGRRICARCGMEYHLVYNMPKLQGKCDKCGGELYQREDDEEKTILTRLSVFNKENMPVIDYYKKNNNFYSIDANGNFDDVAKKIFDILSKIKK
jgi:adenylate kinase